MEHQSKGYNSQDLGSSYLLSLPSEPPDIANWFSSYVYESPELNTNESSVESLSKHSESGEARDKIATDEESNGEKEERIFGHEDTSINELGIGDDRCPHGLSTNSNSPIHEHKDASKVPDSLSSPSILSEPPDIRNWFSSYVYESPALSACSYFEESALKESETQKDIVIIIEESNTKEEEISGAIQSTKVSKEFLNGRKGFPNGCGQYNSTFRGAEQDNQLRNEDDKKDGTTKWLFTKSIHRFENSLEENQEDEALQNHATSLRVVQDSNLCGEASLCKANAKGDHSIASDSAGDFEANVRQNLDSAEPECVLRAMPVSRDSRRESFTVTSYKEPLRNGFITTRRSRFAKTIDKTCLEEKGKSSNCSYMNRAYPFHGENNTVKRKALMETTNLEHFEVTEKWKCPQKSKPKLGPPLKQLRLERWVNRM